MMTVHVGGEMAISQDFHGRDERISRSYVIAPPTPSPPLLHQASRKLLCIEVVNSSINATCHLQAFYFPQSVNICTPIEVQADLDIIFAVSLS